MQTVLVPPFGSNSPLWSLASEFWFYVLFPLGYLALRRKVAWGNRAVYGLLFLLVAYFVRGNVLWGFPSWLLGALLAILPAPSIALWIRWAATAIYLPIFFVWGRIPMFKGPRGDIGLGVLTFGLIWVLLSARARAPEAATSTRLIRTLARFSYTLYVVHVPLLVLFAALLLDTVRWQPGGLHAVEGAILLLMTVAISYGIASLTEFRTAEVRLAVERWLGVSQRHEETRREANLVSAGPQPGTTVSSKGASR